MQESPGLNPDWLGEMSSFSIKNLNISLKINFSNIFPQIGSRELGIYCFKHFLSSFLWIRTTFPFVHSDGKEPLSIACWKMSSSGLQIELPHNCTIWKLTLSWPCALHVPNSGVFLQCDQWRNLQLISDSQSYNSNKREVCYHF